MGIHRVWGFPVPYFPIIRIIMFGVHIGFPH